jgi:hypothetical protein
MIPHFGRDKRRGFEAENGVVHGSFVNTDGPGRVVFMSIAPATICCGRRTGAIQKRTAFTAKRFFTGEDLRRIPTFTARGAKGKGFYAVAARAAALRIDQR